MYADFTDFRIFRMQVERGHWVGGFGQARWLESGVILADPNASQALAEAEPAVLEHMNVARAGSIDLYANRLLGRSGTGWRVIALDPHGCDLARGNAFARLSFPSQVGDSRELQAIFGDLDRTARASA
jgi:putative heme iron utilization protein